MINRNKAGVSLIIVLGLLSLLAILAVALAKSARDTRVSSRGLADQVQADNLLQVALLRASDEVTENMTNFVYPPADVICSTGTTDSCGYILSGSLSNSIPSSLWADALASTGSCHWIATTNGRVAFMIINCSGLLDVNWVGATQRVNGITPLEINVAALPDMGNAGTFTNEYSDGRGRGYTTMDELNRLTAAIYPPAANVFTYSYDPGPNVYFTNHFDLGSPGIALSNKLALKTVFAMSNNYSAAFMNDIFRPLTNIIRESGYTADVEAIGWNMVNYFDPDCIPQTSTNLDPFCDYAVEPVPLINEVAFQTNAAAFPTNHEIAVELWFPFAPAEVGANEYSLVLESAWFGSYTQGIPAMIYGTVSNEFICLHSPSFSNLSATVNAAVIRTTDHIVVDAITNLEFLADGAQSVNDPRLNGKLAYWEPQPPTLLTTNANCEPLTNSLMQSLLPIRHPGTNTIPRSVGEVGYVFASKPWTSINLFSYQGGALLDRLCIQARSERGLVSINTRQGDVIRALLADIPDYGWSNRVISVTYARDPAAMEQLAMAITNITAVNDGCNNYAELMPALGTNSAFTSAFPIQGERNQIFCNIVELLTFRQNIFTVVLAAEVFGADHTSIVARKRALAVVCRDAYTGKCFIRYIRPVID